MSVTVFFHTKQGLRRVAWQKSWLIFAVLFPLLSIVFLGGQLIQAKLQLTELRAHLVELAQWQEPEVQIEELNALQTDIEVQLSALASSFAQMQARMNRVEALGMTLAEQEYLTEQFDFSVPLEPTLDGNRSLSPDNFEQLLDDLQQLKDRLERADRHLNTLESLERQHHIEDTVYLSGPPVLTGRRSSPYGYRNDPFSERRTLHRGLDFAAKEGTSIIATGAGLVSFVGELKGYGNIVEIDHGSGVKTRYAHNKTNLVELGQRVEKGQEIALVGNTGRSTGPHVHYEVLINNRQVNPAKYVDRDPRS